MKCFVLAPYVIIWCLSLHTKVTLGLFMQIVAPTRRTTSMNEAIANGLSDARRNGGLIFQTGYTLETEVKLIDNTGPTPSEITDLFCDSVFMNNASVIMSINYDEGTLSATDCIIKSAIDLGFPVISWNPFYPGALESVENSMVLQIGPTIYHECEGIILLLERYNWTDFSIVTTESIGEDFTDCMAYQVNKTNIIQGYLTRSRQNMNQDGNLGDIRILFSRFTNIATVVLDLKSTLDYFTEVETNYVKMKFQSLIKAKSRIILLHVKDSEALNVVAVAEEMGLTGASYGWILTSSSIGTQDYSITMLPLGFLALGRDAKKPVEAVETGIRIWTEAVKSVIQYEDHASMVLSPSIPCNGPLNQSPWTDGHILYKYMKDVSITDDEKPPVTFTSSGMIEHTELTIMNVKPNVIKIGKKRRTVNAWGSVGKIYPQLMRGKLQMRIETKEIVWPGDRSSPPIGRPERRFFRIVTRQEEPFMIYVPPEESGECGYHSVPCFVNSWNTNMNESSNTTVSYCCTGLCVEVLKSLSQTMKFDYYLYDVPDGQWGVEDPESPAPALRVEHIVFTNALIDEKVVTGEWNGLVKEVLDEKADMILTAFLINKLRNAVLDFSVPFLESGITIMVSIRKGAISPYAFLEPYDVSSWVLILIFSVHATGASIFIFEWLSPSGLDRGNTSTVEHKFSLFRSFWLIWAMLFGAAVSIDVPRGVSSRFLANVWALFALVFLASYTANLAAFMITIDEYYDLSGIEDWRLMRPTTLTPHFKFATIANSSTDINLKLNYQRMNKYMSRYSQPDLHTAKQNLKNQSIHAFLYDANVLEYTAGRDEECSLLTVGRWYAMSGYGVSFKKDSELKHEVDEAILKLQYAGDIERMQAFWLSGACHAKKDKKNKSNSKIEILNFISAFILLAAGVLLGVLLLLLEHLYFKSGRKCLKKYDKCGCCALVSLSMGKSLTFEQSVFEAIDIQRRHKCKDPICEMNLWKARHQLDMALLKIKQIQSDVENAMACQVQPSNGDSANDRNV